MKLLVECSGITKALVLALLMVMLLSGGNILGSSEKPRLTYYVYIAPGSPGIVEAVLEGLNHASVDFQISDLTYRGLDLAGNTSNLSAEALLWQHSGRADARIY